MPFYRSLPHLSREALQLCAQRPRHPASRGLRHGICLGPVRRSGSKSASVDRFHFRNEGNVVRGAADRPLRAYRILPIRPIVPGCAAESMPSVPLRSARRDTASRPPAVSRRAQATRTSMWMKEGVAHLIYRSQAPVCWTAFVEPFEGEHCPFVQEHAAERIQLILPSLLP